MECPWKNGFIHGWWCVLAAFGRTFVCISQSGTHCNFLNPKPTTTHEDVTMPMLGSCYCANSNIYALFFHMLSWCKLKSIPISEFVGKAFASYPTSDNDETLLCAYILQFSFVHGWWCSQGYPPSIVNNIMNVLAHVYFVGQPYLIHLHHYYFIETYKPMPLHFEMSVAMR